MKYTYAVKDFDPQTGDATIVYTPSDSNLPVAEIPAHFGTLYGTAKQQLVVAKNVPWSYWVSIKPDLFPRPTTVEPFVVDPTKQPPPQ